MNNILRYEGKAALAMVGLTTGGVLNIFGDWLLIVKCGMGVEGAGIATAVSQLISFTILLSMFVRKKTACRLSLSSFSGDRRELLMIIKTGFPSLIRQGLSSAATVSYTHLDVYKRQVYYGSGSGNDQLQVHFI